MHSLQSKNGSLQTGRGSQAGSGPPSTALMDQRGLFAHLPADEGGGKSRAGGADHAGR